MFGYNPNGYIKNFAWLRCITYWASALGLCQAIIWMGLTITGILSYNCLIPAPDMLTYGSVIQTVFYDLYFKGDCQPAVYQSFNNEILTSVPTVLEPWQILVWDCVYLGFSVAWLLSSVLLLTHVKKDDLKSTLVVLYIWIDLTFCICAMDLALGVIFGIDYGKFHIEAYNYNLNSVNAGVIDSNAVQLVAGAVTSISMMIVSLKGFILWIINLGLAIYLLVKAINIANARDNNGTLFMPQQESDDILTTRPPISAFDEALNSSMGKVNEAYVPDDHRSMSTLELNQEAIARAARMSTDTSLQDRRFRNIDAFQQYPPPAPPRYNTSHPESAHQPAHQEAHSVIAAPFPAPDYSPPMIRSNQTQSQNGLIRSQKYQ